MSLHHRILAWTYGPLRGVKGVGRTLGVVTRDRLRVLLYHDFAPGEEAAFAAQLRWLRRRWNFVTPQIFESMMSGHEPIRGSNLLLTFDDGFASNRTAAERVLRPLGISAIFFVVSDLVAIEDRVEARRFICKHVYPGTRPEEVPDHWSNLRWTDLEALLDQGHTIGGHTRTHARLAQISDVAQLRWEIVGSADTLAKRLDTPIEHFAYTFGDVASFSASALSVARKRFRFVYSGLRGDNAHGASRFTLRRDAVSAQDSFGLLGAFLEGGADFRYTKARAALGRWV